MFECSEDIKTEKDTRLSRFFFIILQVLTLESRGLLLNSLISMLGSRKWMRLHSKTPSLKVIANIFISDVAKALLRKKKNELMNEKNWKREWNSNYLWSDGRILHRTSHAAAFCHKSSDKAMLVSESSFEEIYLIFLNYFTNTYFQQVSILRSLQYVYN